jgi:hypothetical protein
VLQFPGHGHTIDKPELVPEEFVAKENVNYQKDMSASEGANADERTVKTANLLSPPIQEEPSRATRQGPLTFNPSPPTKEAKDIQLSVANEQAKLMQWHYRLGPLTFPRLKQLALNGEIPKKLAKVLTPKCACCLFGSMTKLPWQGKETKANHEVLVATKPGECVLVDQMTSTEVGFLHNRKANSPRSTTNRPPSSLTTSAASNLSTSSSTMDRMKDFPPSLPLSSLQQNTESKSYTTIATTDASTTTPSNKHVTKQGNNSPSVG